MESSGLIQIGIANFHNSGSIMETVCSLLCGSQYAFTIAVCFHYYCGFWLSSEAEKTMLPKCPEHGQCRRARTDEENTGVS